MRRAHSFWKCQPDGTVLSTRMVCPQYGNCFAMLPSEHMFTLGALYPHQITPLSSRLEMCAHNNGTTECLDSAAGVRVDGREVAAKCVVVAMGPWTKSAAAWFEGIPKIQAQKAHSIVMQPSGEVSADCLFLAHTNKQGAVFCQEHDATICSGNGCMTAITLNLLGRG